MSRPSSVTTEVLGTWMHHVEVGSGLAVLARGIPVAGEPPGTAALLSAASDHLVASDVRTLLVTGKPGVLKTSAVIGWCRDHLRRLEVVDVGDPAGHFLPEDRPHAVADALLDRVPAL